MMHAKFEKYFLRHAPKIFFEFDACIINRGFAVNVTCKIIKIKIKNIDHDVTRTRNLLIWNQTRCHCATQSLTFTIKRTKFQ